MFLKVLLSGGIMLAIAFICALLLTLVNLVFGEKQSEEEKEIVKRLGGANCGGCGKTGCVAFAQALLKGEVKVTDCTITSQENKNEILKILGQDIIEDKAEEKICPHKDNCPNYNKDLIPKNAKVYVSCINKDKGKQTFSNCKNGCIGCSLCLKKCKYNAIVMDNKIPKIDNDKCVGCYECVKFCPVKCMKKNEK